MTTEPKTILAAKGRTIRELPAKRGSELTAAEQAYCLSAFVHRFTREHKPKWAKAEWKDGKPYPVQFASDKEWLEQTLFAVTAKGNLDHRVIECRCSPTWPDNPELRKPESANLAEVLGAELT